VATPVTSAHGSMLDGWNVVAAEPKKAVDPVMGGQEALAWL